MKQQLLKKSAVAAGVAALALTAAAQTSSAADLKMAFFASPKHHVWDKFMAPWGKDLESKNVGLKVLGFPGSQIGGKPPGAFKRVVNGIADIEFGLQGYTSTVFPKTMVAEIPMQFENAMEATRGLWRILDTYLNDEYSRVKVLGLWTTDTPVLMTNKVVKTPADLAGVKLRTPSRDQAEIIKGLGAIPVAMPMPATYQAIEKGVVDGSLVGISVVKSFKLAEVVKNYLAGLPMGFSPQFVVMNRKAYNALNPSQKKAIDDSTGLEWSLRAAKLYEEAREEGIALVKERKDTNFTEITAAQKAEWNAKFKDLSDHWVGRFEKQGFKDYAKMLAAYMGKGS
jgi:TRAP-type C4-dicarboxylate transport system substrate-binding protein